MHSVYCIVYVSYKRCNGKKVVVIHIHKGETYKFGNGKRNPNSLHEMVLHCSLHCFTVQCKTQC